MFSADICSSATTPRVYASMTQSICASDSAVPVALGADDVDGVERLGLMRRSSRSAGPNASGSTSVIGLMPCTVSTSSRAPPCSHSSCRHRPHGMSTLPCSSTQVNATSRPPPVTCSAETSAHSAHSVTPYEAFSTLQPTTTRPSSTSAAAPTGKLEYGAYALCMTSVAAARRASQSTRSRSSTAVNSLRCTGCPRRPAGGPVRPARRRRRSSRCTAASA